MARAMGGRVIKDLARAEVGTHQVFLTEQGQADPIFKPLGESFKAQMGHEDCVVELPRGATLLASSKMVQNQAYRFDGLPIYCTQFHPELTREDLFARVESYPDYIERIARVPPDEFCESLEKSPHAEELLRRFVTTILG